MEQSLNQTSTGGDMSRLEKSLLKFFSADSKALEWAMTAFAFVWGISAMVTLLHHHTVYEGFLFQGSLWLTLNGALVILSAMRGAALLHCPGGSSVRRVASSLLVCTWGTLGVYLISYNTIFFFSVVYANATFIEFWIAMRLSFSGADRWNGSQDS